MDIAIPPPRVAALEHKQNFRLDSSVRIVGCKLVGRFKRWSGQLTKVDHGIYAAYLTGRAAQGVAFLIFRDGKITGADLGGFLFDGSIEGLKIDLTVRAKGGVPTIHGSPTPSEGLSYKLVFDIPDDPNKYIAIRTPFGPVNVRLERIRDLGALEEHP